MATRTDADRILILVGFIVIIASLFSSFTMGGAEKLQLWGVRQLSDLYGLMGFGMRVFRYEIDGQGVFERVELDCPREDSRRIAKPDGGWVPKVGERFPGAISFWTEAGLNRYRRCGLEQWHLSVVNGAVDLCVAEFPREVLYQDEFQVICDLDQVEIIRRIPLHYFGPKPYQKAVESDRGPWIENIGSLRSWVGMAYYSQSREVFSPATRLGALLGLERVAVNHETIPPGTRTSWPHAHLVEEELVYVLQGNPEIWANGELFSGMPGDLFLFPAGTGLAHTVINRGKDAAQVIVLGMQGDYPDKIIYPLHPARNDEVKERGFFWDDCPKQLMGTSNGEPDSKEPLSHNRHSSLQRHFSEVPGMEFGSKAAKDRVWLKDRDLARALGTKVLALHHCTLASGYRSSLPHAESHEEEFVYILSGKGEAWISGYRYPIAVGDAISFPAGTGIPHCILNESGSDLVFLTIGELTKLENLCSFPCNPEQSAKSPIWWEDPPEQKLGDASPIPV